MALNITNFTHALKQNWPKKRLDAVTYKDNPLLAMLAKDENAGGENIVVPVRYGDPQGRSATFATAQANKGNQQGTKFILTRSKDYSLASIDNETIEASKKDELALLKAADSEIEGATNSLVRSLAIKLYGTGSGSIGKIATGGISSSTITLATPDDVTNFEKGMVIVLSTADGGGSVKSGSLTIAGVDRDNGTITTTQAVTTGVATAAAADFIFVQGDYDAAVKGLQAWMPSTVTSTAFFGVDRTADATRLAGVRMDGSALTVQEALLKLAYRVGREGGSPSHCFVNFEQFANLEIDLGSKVQYEDLAVGEIGFRGIKVNGPKGVINVLPDMNCPKGVGFMLSMKNWKLYSLGKAPHILNLDGEMIRETSADAYEVRIAYYAQLGCDAPGYSGRTTLAT